MDTTGNISWSPWHGDSLSRATSRSSQNSINVVVASRNLGNGSGTSLLRSISLDLPTELEGDNTADPGNPFDVQDRSGSLELELNPSAQEGDSTVADGIDSPDVLVMHRRLRVVSFTSIMSDEELLQQVTLSRDVSIASQADFHFQQVAESEANAQPEAPDLDDTDRQPRPLPIVFHGFYRSTVESFERQYVLRPPCLLRTSSCDSSVSSLGTASEMLKTPAEHATNESAAANPYMKQISRPRNEACAICLESFEVGEVVQPMVGCKHLFHRSCVAGFIDACREDLSTSSWRRPPLGERLKCPLCRGRLATQCLSDVPQQERDLVVSLDGFAYVVSDSVGAQDADGEYLSRQNTDGGNLLRRTSSQNTNIAIAARNLGGDTTDNIARSISLSSSSNQDGPLRSRRRARAVSLASLNDDEASLEYDFAHESDGGVEITRSISMDSQTEFHVQPLNLPDHAVPESVEPTAESGTESIDEPTLYSSVNWVVHSSGCAVIGQIANWLGMV